MPMSLEDLIKYADRNGIAVEVDSNPTSYECWLKTDSSVVAVSFSLAELAQDVADFIAQKEDAKC